MSVSTQKKSPARGLGKGIDILIPDMLPTLPSEGENVFTLGINEIEPNRAQPRRTFDDEALLELSNSISEHGIIQPIIVRKSDGYYEIVAGERRWRAARMAGLTEIPVITRDFDEQGAMVVALIENLQREELTGVEEALAYKRLRDDFGLTQEEIAERVGKKRSTIANTIRLLNLPQNVLSLLNDGRLSNGHAKALLSIDDKALQSQIAEKIAKEDLSVRQTEALVKGLSRKKERDESAKPSANPYSFMYKDIEKQLGSILGTRVKLSPGRNKSKIEIEFFSDDDLDRLFELFKKLEE